MYLLRPAIKILNLAKYAYLIKLLNAFKKIIQLKNKRI